MVSYWPFSDEVFRVINVWNRAESRSRRPRIELSCRASHARSVRGDCNLWPRGRWPHFARTLKLLVGSWAWDELKEGWNCT